MPLCGLRFRSHLRALLKKASTTRRTFLQHTSKEVIARSSESFLQLLTMMYIMGFVHPYLGRFLAMRFERIIR